MKTTVHVPHYMHCVVVSTITQDSEIAQIPEVNGISNGYGSQSYMHAEPFVDSPRLTYLINLKL